VAGIQAAGPASLIDGMLPATGEPAALLSVGMLGLAGIGLFMRRISRRQR
jgi:LPXTG-motif cell wall-anchored protein